MTPQELDARVEQLAEEGASVDTLVAVMLSESVPSDRATKIANDWVAYVRDKTAASLKDPENFFQSEVERLREMLNRKCSEFWNDDIDATIAEWASFEEERTMRFFVEKDETMSLKIGSKVQVLGMSGSGNPNVVIQYGVVAHNYLAFAVEEQPFTDLEARADADVVEAKLGTDPSEEVKEQVFTEAKRLAEENQSRLKYMAGLTFVTWFDKDGHQICQSWNDPERLIEIPEGQ
jgi:type I restriction-modification system DNA methylase subunit